MIPAIMVVYAAVSALFTLVIPFLSLLLIVAILTSRKWRQSLHHVTIASLTFGDLAIGLIVCPIAFLDGLGLYHGCLSLFASGISIIAVVVSCWGLVCLHMYYLFSVLGVSPRGLSARASKALRVLGCLLPWIMALIAVLSLLETTPMGYCRFSLRTREDVYFAIVTWVPLSIVLVLSVVNVICHRFCRPTGADAVTAQLIRTAKAEVGSPYVAVAVSVVTAAMFLPFDIYFVTNMNYLITDLNTYFALLLLSNAKSAVVPLVWMADADIRARMANAVCCRYHQDDEDAMEKEVTYKSLQQKDDVSMDEKAQP